MSGRQTTGRLAAVQRLAGRRCVKSGTHSGTARLARKKQSYCRADSQRMAHGEVSAGAPPRVTVGARAGHTGSRDTFLALRFALHAKGEELVKLGIIFRGKTQLYTTRTKGGETGGRPPIGGRFRQQNRTPFFRFTSALGLRSLQKNGYFPVSSSTNRHSKNCQPRSAMVSCRPRSWPAKSVYERDSMPPPPPYPLPQAHTPIPVQQY